MELPVVPPVMMVPAVMPAPVTMVPAPMAARAPATVNVGRAAVSGRPAAVPACAGHTPRCRLILRPRISKARVARGQLCHG